MPRSVTSACVTGLRDVASTTSPVILATVAVSADEAPARDCARALMVGAHISAPEMSTAVFQAVATVPTPLSVVKERVTQPFVTADPPRWEFGTDLGRVCKSLLVLVVVEVVLLADGDGPQPRRWARGLP